MFTRRSPSPRPGPSSSRRSPSPAPCSVRSFRGALAGLGRGGRGLAASRGRCVGCEPVTSHLCSGAALEGHRPGPVGEFLVSARSTGVFVPRSPTHAPWLLAHKIQSPQEREALHALTVSLPRASGRCPEPGRAGPRPVSVWRVPAVPACCPRESRPRGAWAPMPASISLGGSPEPAAGRRGQVLRLLAFVDQGWRGQGPGARPVTEEPPWVRPGALRHTRLVWGAAAVARRASGPFVAGTSCF